MQVRDLIYLLQTRCQQDDPVIFELIQTHDDGDVKAFEINTEEYADFHMITRMNDNTEKAYCSIAVDIDEVKGML